MSETLKLKVDTGAVTVDLEDANGNQIGTFEFVPTDSDILKRFDAVVDVLNAIDLNNSPDAAAINRAADTVKEQFDFLLCGPVSAGIFAKCGPFTVVNSGDFYFEAVLEGVGNIIESKTKQRIDKKLAKARKAAAKYKQ